MKVIAVPLLLLLVSIPFGAKASSGLAEPQIPLPSVSWPQYPTPDNITDIKEIPKEDQPRGWLLRRLDNLSGGIDTFFVDRFFNEDITDEVGGGSQARFSFFTRREFGDPVDYKFGVSLKLELPHTNKRLNLLLKSEDEDVREGDIFESPENVTYSSALRFIIRESELWSASVDTGVRWGLPPDPFIRAKARRPFYFDHWNFRITQEVNYYTENGYGSITDFRFDRPFTTHRLLRLETRSEYLLNNDYFNLMYGGGIYHEINHLYAYAVLAKATGDNQYGATFDEYELGIRLRRRVFSDWMFAEVHPQYIWTRENHWKPTPVLMFRLQAEFGG